jgi:hypothetical protein
MRPVLVSAGFRRVRVRANLYVSIDDHLARHCARSRSASSIGSPDAPKKSPTNTPTMNFAINLAPLGQTKL